MGGPRGGVSLCGFFLGARGSLDEEKVRRKNNNKKRSSKGVGQRCKRREWVGWGEREERKMKNEKKMY